MTGKAGRSGGARPGSGPKPRPEPHLPEMAECGGPQEFLLGVMNDAGSDARLRIDAAKSLLPYMYPKKGESGKKDDRQSSALKVGAGRFSPATAPKLVVNNRV